MQRIQEELARAAVEGDRFRRQRVHYAWVAVACGAAGLARVALGIDDADFGRVVVALAVLIVIGGGALMMAVRVGRQLAGVSRRAAVLLDMLEERRGMLKPALSVPPEL